MDRIGPLGCVGVPIVKGFGRRDFSVEDERDFDARVKTMRHFRFAPERAA